MNRSAGSMLDNIAECFGRGSRIEVIHFLSIVTGSAAELQSQIYRCSYKECMDDSMFIYLSENINAVYKKTNGFIKYLIIQ